jgi:hypothetical protein
MIVEVFRDGSVKKVDVRPKIDTHVAIEVDKSDPLLQVVRAGFRAGDLMATVVVSECSSTGEAAAKAMAALLAVAIDLSSDIRDWFSQT